MRERSTADSGCANAVKKVGSASPDSARGAGRVTERGWSMWKLRIAGVLATVVALAGGLTAASAVAATKPTKTLELYVPALKKAMGVVERVEARGGTYTFESSGGTVTCPMGTSLPNGFGAWSEENNLPKDTLLLTEPKGSYNQGHCEGAFAPLKPFETFYGSWFNANPQKFGPLILSATKAAELKEHDTEQIEFQVFDGAHGCDYRTKKMKGKITSLAAPLTVAFKKQKAAFFTSTTTGCPTEIKVSATFTIWNTEPESGPVPVEGIVH